MSMGETGVSRPDRGYVPGMTEVREKADLRELSMGELVSRLTEQISHLVRDEMRLAQAELKQKGKRAGLGAGLASAGGVLSLFGLGALTAAAIAAIALVLPVWASGLIVGGAILLLAGLVTLAGVGKVKQATPPMPEQAIASTKRDIQAVKESAQR